jgi:hypothetical protein
MPKVKARLTGATFCSGVDEALKVASSHRHPLLASLQQQSGVNRLSLGLCSLAGAAGHAVPLSLHQN